MAETGNPTISYAQRFEDMHLLRALGATPRGFYIDIGAGHPVFDNVSFAFYLRGWHGVTVEPNPWLAELSAAVRPRDIRVQSLIGETAGEATYYLVEDFHGLSTTVEQHAQRAQSALGKKSKAATVPVTTLRDLCGQHAPDEIEFLKIDVEGAERAVLLGGDWQRFRPKIVVLEALEPITMKPAWEAWESILLGSRYNFAYFDTLNRYYVAKEHARLADQIAAGPAAGQTYRFGDYKPAFDDPSHPDHGLARLLDGWDMVRLPLMPPDAIVDRLINGVDAARWDRPAEPADMADAHQRLFGKSAMPDWVDSLALPSGATIRTLYRSAVATEAFRAALGRISASSAW
jgi:FkbM family methyltransferase